MNSIKNIILKIDIYLLL